MHELHAILDAWTRDPADDALLATVVHVTGSAYRRPGARMFVPSSRQRVGTISGGCLEADVVRRGFWATAGSRPVVRVYDTTGDEDAAWEFGLGCRGVIQILLERTRMASCAAQLDFLQRQRAAGLASVIATVIRTEPDAPVSVGDRLMVDAQGASSGALAATVLAGEVYRHAQLAAQRHESAIVHLPGVDLFVEWVAPPVSLVILGAGDDAQPLAAMGRTLGWSVVVADSRPGFARPERFPGADVRAIVAGASVLPIPVDHRSHVVMMTHNYPLDRQLLPRVMAAGPAYLGLLGPLSRSERLFRDCGLTMTECVHAPVGLDLGGDTPATIAAAILGEIQACVSGRTGGKLRDRTVGIHAPVAVRGASTFPGAPAGVSPDICGVTDGVA